MDSRKLALLTLGVVTAGSLDLLFAMTYWGVLAGVSPVRILQSVARGLLGAAAFQGGLGTALLGVVLHYSIITVMLACYYLASLRLPVLWRKPLLFGPAYGLVLYAVMNYVVVPLSAAGPAPFNLSWVVSGFAVHVFLVGLTLAVSVHLAMAQR